MNQLGANFAVAIGRVLGNEGGYVNNVNDPGGETQWGISRRSYPRLDIKNLTRDAAVPLAIASQLLDFAVNSGHSVATRALQRAAGVADDGVIGPHTREALAAMSPHDLVMRFLAERLIFMTGLKTWPSFGAGWARRVAQQLRYGAEDV